MSWDGQLRRRSASLRLFVGSGDVGADAATRRECGHQLDRTRLENLNQIIENAIGDSLIEHPLIAKSLQIKLETLQFDAPFIRYISQRECRKIWLSRLRTDRSELGTNRLNGVVSLRRWILESLQGIFKIVTQRCAPMNWSIVRGIMTDSLARVQGRLAVNNAYG